MDSYFLLDIEDIFCYTTLQFNIERIYMKITIDTDIIKNSVKQSSKKLWDRADAGHIALLSISAILSVNVISSKLDNMFRQSKQFTTGTVDVTLEKPDKVYEKNIKAPKTKYSQLYNTGVRLNLSNHEFDCLSRNIYWETQHEPLIGQIGVANITYNRVLSGRWGDNFCDVVYSPKQFSWTNSKKIRNATPKNEKQWERAKHSAMLFTRGVRVTNLDKSQFYYANYIKKPHWSKNMIHVVDIGQHKFFNGD